MSKKSEVATLLSMHIVPGTLFSKGISWAEHQTLADGKAPIATQVNTVTIEINGGTETMSRA